jgi:hypothetical protein
MNYIDGFFSGIVGGLLAIAIVVTVASFTYNPRTYEQGVKDTHKEAHSHGLMTKEIDKDDKVIYRWAETHKLGYE